MSAAGTAHQKIIDLLDSFAPSPLWEVTYPTHEKANLVIPSASVEVQTDTPLPGDSALIAQELLDNRNVRLSIRIHTGYRLGPVDTDSAVDIADAVVRWIRENINLAGGYRVFDVSGIAYNVTHDSSGTTGAEVMVDIHKVESYVQN